MVPLGKIGAGGREDGKTGGSAPTEFFGGITDLYFTPDLPSDVYVFNILDAHRARARCTDASLPLNVQRSTNSYPLSYLPIPPLAVLLLVPLVVVLLLLILLLVVVVVVVVVVAFTLSPPLISTQIRDLLSASFPLLAFSFLAASFSVLFSLVPFPSSLFLFHSHSLSVCLSVSLATYLLRVSFAYLRTRISAYLSRLFSFPCSPTS